MFSSLTRLQNWKLDASYLPADRAFYEKVKPSKSLKAANFWNSIASREAACGFLRNFPNIENLKFYEDIGNFIDVIATYNTMLVYLSIGEIKTALQDGVRFNKLRRFSVSGIESSNA